MPSLNNILISAAVIIAAIWGFFTGSTKEANKRLNEEVKGVKTARKIEDENRNLTRKQLIDGL